MKDIISIIENLTLLVQTGKVTIHSDFEQRPTLHYLADGQVQFELHTGNSTFKLFGAGREVVTRFDQLGEDAQRVLNPLIEASAKYLKDEEQAIVDNALKLVVGLQK